MMSETSANPENASASAVSRWKREAPAKSTPPPSGGAVYGLGMIGALVYFVGTADSRSDYVLAFGKAVVWPALLVYRAFRTLGE